MALVKRTEVGSRNVLPNGVINIRTDTIIEDDGVVMSRAYHRHVLAPGDDLTGEDPTVVLVANAIWTADVIAAYEAAQSLSLSPVM